MSFYLFLLCGFLGGLFGGMGMGGGTLLIPLLTLFCGVEQGAAQGVNLLAFLPMSLAALSVHARDGLVKREGLGALIFSAAASSFAVSLFAARLPSRLLRPLFGGFLVALSFVRAAAVFRKNKDARPHEKSR